ncbi:MAG: serine/threonine-protein kinase [Myxococcota bacterium]
MPGPQLDDVMREAPRGGSLASKRALAQIESELFDRPPRPLTLARYVLLDRLGAGGVGLVYRGYDPQLDRKVAIKLLQAGRRQEPRDTDGRVRLLREAQALAQLSHPNVIAVHDVGSYTEEDLSAPGEAAAPDIPPRGVFVVMELVDGPTLREWMQAPHPWTDSLDVLGAAGAGLAAAHAEGLVHRDFKPDNVLVGADGRVRVLDFGLARSFGAEADRPSSPSPVEAPGAADGSEADGSSMHTRLTATGTVMGTPQYMAPEQHRGETADARSDQFSFCACLYEAVFGERPYAGDSLAALDAAKRAGPRPPPEGAAVPKRVRNAILRGLSPDPSARFPSMAALLSELKRARGQRRRRLTVGAAAAVIGLVAASASRVSAGDDACSGHVSRLDGLWDDDRKQAIRSAFTATDVGMAPEAWAKVSDGVDTYAVQWVELRTEVCRAALRGEANPDVMERQVQCLDRRLSGLAEMLTVFAAADAATVRNAALGVTQLTPLTRCLSGTTAEEDELPPPGPRRDQAIEIGARLDRSNALRLAGRFDDALETAGAATTHAVALGHHATEVKARRELAVVHERMGALDDASQEIHSALLAAERSGLRPLVDGVMILIVAFEGYVRSRHAVGDRLVEQLEARFELVPPSGPMRMDFEMAVAILRNDEGRPDAALRRIDAALALRTHMRPEQVGNALNLKGNILMSQERLPESRAVHERALALRQELYGDRHTVTAQTYNNLALVDQLAGDLDGAIAALHHTLEIQREVWGEGHVNLSSPLNNLGVTYGLKQDYETALDYYEQAQDLRVQRLGNKHSDTARGYVNLAGVLCNLRRFEACLKAATQASASLEGIVAEDNLLASQALWFSGFATVGLGDREEGMAAVAAARAMYGRLEVTDARYEGHLYLDIDALVADDE